MANDKNNLLDFQDPGAIGDELIDVPGFINELKNHTLAVSSTEALPNEIETITMRKSMSSLAFFKLDSGDAEAGYNASCARLSGSLERDIQLWRAGYPTLASGISNFWKRDI